MYLICIRYNGGWSPPTLSTLPEKNMREPASSRLSSLLREWDKGSKSVRMQILADFVEQCHSMTGPQLEKALGNGASLLLARISSWLRLSYALGSSAALQLRAISIFVAASSGQRFLAEFVEVILITPKSWKRYYVFYRFYLKDLHV